MTAKIQVRRDITGTGGTGWSSNPTLSDGEIGFDKTLKQLKIGDGATAWSSLPWLGDALPYLTSASTDFNNADYRVQGRYFLASPSSFTNGPSAPEDIKSDDGSAVLFIVKFDTSFLQILTTRGNSGTSPVRPTKSYIRRYDGTNWFGWEPLTTWAQSATEGVELTAKSLSLTDTGSSSLVVDGSATIKGSTTLGDATTDVVTVQAGTVAAPIITKSGDTNTGIYFPAADKIAFSAGGTALLTLDNTPPASEQDYAVFHKGAKFGGAVSLENNRLMGVDLAHTDNDALPLVQLFGYAANVLPVGQEIPLISFGLANGTSGTVATETDASGLDLWTTRYGSGSLRPYLNPPAGVWIGFVMMFDVWNLVAIKEFTAASPCDVTTNDNFLTGAPLQTTRHLWIMARVG